VAEAFAAIDAVIGLAYRGNGAVVAHEVSLLELGVILLGRILGVGALGDGAVVMLEGARDVNTPGARHAVLAVRAVDQRILHHLGSHLLQELQFLFRKGLEMAEGLYVLLERIHVGHTGEDAQHARIRGAEAEGPGGHALVRFALLHMAGDAFRHAGQTAAQQRFHNNYR